MYLAPTPENVTDVLALARAAGVRYAVDLSGEPESWWGSVCVAVEDSGLAWTHLWPADLPITSVPDITGRPATTFAEWTTGNISRFTAE